MDDTNGRARLAAHLNSKKAGSLVCPICAATETFEARGVPAGHHPPAPLSSAALLVAGGLFAAFAVRR